MATTEDSLAAVPGATERRDRWTSPDPPVSLPRPMMFQAWRDCAFVHWPFSPEAIRPLVPAPFEIQTFEGEAWVSIISFRIARMRARGLPMIPGLSSGLETHARTYVRGPDGRAGIWLMSLDFAPLAGALMGRFGFALPYWWAEMEVERSIGMAAFRSRRRGGADASFDLRLRLGDEIPAARSSDVEDFVTARWVLYSGVGPIRAAILTEHPRWKFREASIERLDQSITTASGLPTVGRPPLVHFSDGVDARLSWPRPFLGRSDG